MGYCDDARMVRVDFFKPASGKWYCTEAVKWTGAYEGVLIHDAFKKSLDDHFERRGGTLGGMVAICLEPYHQNAHPISIRIPE